MIRGCVVGSAWCHSARPPAGPGAGDAIDTPRPTPNLTEHPVPRLPRASEVPTKARRFLGGLLGSLLEGDIKAAFAVLEALCDEAEPEDGLPRARRTEDDGGLPGTHASTHQVIEPGDPAGHPAVDLGRRLRG